ncbi:MAG: glutamine cyclotransferase [Desulfobacca sp.]|nr:glutamine cyclotransferase [Desulfobacca sp.]
MKRNSQYLNVKAFILGCLILWSLFCFIIFFDPRADAALDSIPVYGYKIINIFPHDPKAFTQGLVFYNGFLYEGTGLSEKSYLRKVQLETGKILKQISLPAEFFGEGVTLWGSKIIQLTWQSGVGFVYDLGTFQFLKKFHYRNEGWGITQDGKHLIMSDGTDTLTFLDPNTFKEQKRIRVHDRGLPIALLNELEYIKGEIFANVFLTDRIARISPNTGLVNGWVDLKGLLTEADRAQGVDVLNGIAYDAQKDRIFVTGKYWPKLFEIEITRK